MTSDQFRSSGERVAAFRELLQNGILADAIVVLKDMSPSLEVPVEAEAIASVRVAEGKKSWDKCIETFLELAVPMPQEPEEPEPTWGVKLKSV